MARLAGVALAMGIGLEALTVRRPKKLICVWVRPEPWPWLRPGDTVEFIGNYFTVVGQEIKATGFWMLSLAEAGEV